jgi:hypothetical protein
MPGPARKYLTDIDTPSAYKQSYIPDEYMLPEMPALPGRPGDMDSDRYAMHSSGMPHRSGEVGDHGRHDGTHLTAREMAELQRSGRLEQMIRRLQRARAARAGVEATYADEEPEMPAPYDPNF